MLAICSALAMLVTTEAGKFLIRGGLVAIGTTEKGMIESELKKRVVKGWIDRFPGVFSMALATDIEKGSTAVIQRGLIGRCLVAGCAG